MSKEQTSIYEQDVKFITTLDYTPLARLEEKLNILDEKIQSVQNHIDSKIKASENEIKLLVALCSLGMAGAIILFLLNLVKDIAFIWL